MPSEYDRGDKMRRWEDRLTNPSKALEVVGRVLVKASRDAFTDQRFDGTVWRERRVPNVFGIIADLSEGKTPPARRFDPGPALRDTGRLSGPGGITYRIVSADTVQVGRAPDLDYADVHHYGGRVESKTITAEVQERLAKWLDGVASPFVRQAAGFRPTERTRREDKIRASLAWLLNKKFTGKKLEGKVPARPFVGVTRQSFNDVAELIGTNIFEV